MDLVESAVVGEGILADADRFQVGEETEQGITRPRDEDRIARIAEELEEVRLGRMAGIWTLWNLPS